MELHPELLASLQERGLESVLRTAERLGGGRSARLAADLAGIDWATYDRQRLALKRAGEGSLGEMTAPELVPPSADADADHTTARELGESALRAGQVAVLTVAGGQASRLGFDGPKGAFPLATHSGTSLFQGFAGQIRRLREVYGCALPWVIQTGPANHLETQRFFERRNWFGLGSDSIHFVCQGTLPALAPNGELLLSAPDRLFRNPDGHGGVFLALKRSKCLPRLQHQGITCLFYCQVDNPLVWMADPVFLGHHLQRKARMSVKVVEKTDPAEKVGLVVQLDGRHRCVEYSDVPEELQAEQAADGGLRFRAGNIAIHAFDLDFLEEMAEAKLQLHLARKDVLALAPGGLVAEPRPGVKFETFVFDALPLADVSMVQLADRSLEFAPVKNRAGVDSIATSRVALQARTRRWLEQAGLVKADATGSLAPELEPGLCLGPEDLASRREQVADSAGIGLWKLRR